MESPTPSIPPRTPPNSLPAEAEPDITGPIDPLLAAALLPARLIQPGEIIVLLLKPSPWYIILASSRTLAVIALLTLAILLLNAKGLFIINRADLLLLAIGLASLRLFWQLLDWLNQVYVLTDRRILRLRGVIRIQIFEAALKKIQHTSTYFSFRERLFGLGTISFATASAGGAIQASWLMLANPLDVHQTVIQTLGRYR